VFLQLLLRAMTLLAVALNPTPETLLAWQVLCVDPSKARLAEQAVNGYCADMQMPKAINQSSQLVESPVGVMRLSDINCSTDFYEGLPPDECSQFSQCC
jgi:hypothetical protein